MNKDDYILSIGAGINQLDLIESINEMGFKSISCDIDSHAPGKKISDVFINISSHDYISIIKKIKSLDLKLRAVVTRSTGIPVYTASKVSEYFGLLSLKSEVSKILIDKNAFIHKMNLFKIPSPKMYSLNDKDNIEYPIFIKPSKTNKSHASMNTCYSFEELEEAFLLASSTSDDGSVNIEEYLIGSDIVSIDYIFNNEITHLAALGEISSGKPHFDGIGWYTCPSNIDKVLQNNVIYPMVEKLKPNYAFLQTATKTNFINKNSKVYEVHAEIGGDLVNDIFIPHILKGHNVFKTVINLYLGIKPSLKDVKKTCSILLFKDKINKYKIDFRKEKIINIIENNKYVLMDFNNYSEMFKYLNKLENVSISNDEGVKVELE